MSKKLPKIIVVVGPTASGKTDLAIKLTGKFGGEVVSADSRQVYREFSIGTAKPPGRWVRRGGKNVYMVEGVPHYLMDEVDPKEEFTLVDFKNRALEATEDILSRGKLPFLVGGTALYARSITENLQIPQVPPQAAFRARMVKKSTDDLYNQLKKIDPEAAKITGQNKRRIIRALEVINATGKKFSAQRKKGPRLFKDLKIGIVLKKEGLNERIEKRLQEMIREGLLDEVKKLAQKYSWEIPPMQSIDYQEFREYLAGEESLEDAIAKTVRAHKSFARRQMTWFKRDKDISWIKDYSGAERTIEKFLST